MRPNLTKPPTIGQNRSVRPEDSLFASPLGCLLLAIDLVLTLVSERDEALIASSDHGETFHPLRAHPRKATICPMSSTWLGESATGTLAAWENSGRVWVATIPFNATSLTRTLGARGKWPEISSRRRGSRGELATGVDSRGSLAESGHSCLAHL